MFKDVFSPDSTFSRFMNLLWNVILVSLLWLVSALGLVTLCPGTTAAYYAMAKCVRHGEGTVLREFWRSFKENLRPGWPVSLIFLGVLAVLVLDCTVCYGSEETLLLLYLFYLLILLATLCFLVYCPILSRFSDTRLALLRMTLAVAGRHFPSSFLLLVILAAACFGAYMMPWSVLILPGAGFLAQTFVMEPVLLRYGPKPGEDGYDPDKWYNR